MEKKWEERWKAFQEKYDPLYPRVVLYIDINLVQPYKERLIKAWVDVYIYWDNQVTSRGEGLHRIFKNGLATSRGDLKKVINKYLLILRRQYREIAINME
jgi:hypothetical protein